MSLHQGSPAAHTHDWLITYADMITLLLCFFVIFFVILSSRKNGPVEAPADATQVAQKVQPKPAPIIQGGLAFLDQPMNRIADEVAAEIGKPRRAAQVIAMPVAAVTASAKSSMEPEMASVNVDHPEPHGGTPDIAPKGDRITTLEMSSSAFFGSGSASLSEGGKSILRHVAVDLQADRYAGYEIVVEGHTDDTPISTPQFSSNWELSTARAAAVVHFLLDQGIPAQKLRASGYADTFPKVPNRDADGNAIPENQAQNRRVVIELEKIEK